MFRCSPPSVRSSAFLEALEAQQFQPVRVVFTGEDFGGALANTLGMFAAQEAAVIEEEAQQVQIFGAQVFSQEEVVAQSAVEILDDGAGV